MILTGEHPVCMALKLSFVQRIKQAFYLLKILGFKNLKPIKIFPVKEETENAMPSHSVDACRYILDSRFNLGDTK
jgi:hypothetical protein